MKIPEITKIVSVEFENEKEPWVAAREAAAELNPEPEFHWKNKITMFENLRQALGYTSVWSIHEVERLYEVAFEGYIAGLHYHPYNGDGYMDITITLNVTDPTWFDIWNACENAIIESQHGGNHHQFIEQITRQGSSLYLYTGS